MADSSARLSATCLAATVMRYDRDDKERASNLATYRGDFTSVEVFEWDLARIAASLSSSEPKLVAIAPIEHRLHVLEPVWKLRLSPTNGRVAHLAFAQMPSFPLFRDRQLLGAAARGHYQGTFQTGS